MTNTSVEIARFELVRAQERLREAEEAARVLQSFPVVGEVWVVSQKAPVFEQWVTYPEEGIVVGVFHNAELAERYTREVKPAPGFDFVVESKPMFG